MGESIVTINDSNVIPPLSSSITNLANEIFKSIIF